MHATRNTMMGLLAFTAALLLAPGLHAAAPLVKGQAPGFYRMMLGDLEVTAFFHHPAKQAFSHRAAADVSGADKENFLLQNP